MMVFGTNRDEQTSEITDGYLTFDSGKKVLLTDDECKEVSERLLMAKASGKIKLPPIEEDENKTITILQHTISYFLRDTNLGIEIDGCSSEHIEYLIGQGFSEGDLSVCDSSKNVTYHGWWKIVK